MINEIIDNAARMILLNRISSEGKLSKASKPEDNNESNDGTKNPIADQ